MAGVNSGDSPVQFRKRDAERINAAVLAKESSRRERNPSKLPRAAGGGGAVEGVRFTGAWPQNTYKQVFYSFDTTNTSTASVLNLFCSILPNSTYRVALVAPLDDIIVLVNSQC
jgi:hypothetical protein